MITYKAIARLRFKDGTEMDMTIHHFAEHETALKGLENYSYANAETIGGYICEQEYTKGEGLKGIKQETYVCKKKRGGNSLWLKEKEVTL